MKTHKAKRIVLRTGIITTSLCSRLNNKCKDGMNITENDNEVTCKFCLDKLKDTK